MLVQAHIKLVKAFLRKNLILICIKFGTELFIQKYFKFIYNLISNQNNYLCRVILFIKFIRK
jgi:hypothetical protein